MKPLRTTKLIWTLVFCVLAQHANSQVKLQLKGLITESTNKNYIDGTEIELLGLDEDGFGGAATIKINGGSWQMEWPPPFQIEFQRNNLIEFWQSQALEYEAYEFIGTNGLKLDLRHEMDVEAIEYVKALRQNGLLFEDAQLQSYLYALISSIHPYSIQDGRPGLLTIHVMKNDQPNAFVAGNGSMFLSTGLLSLAQSEDELVAVLAHEIAHFNLDHQMRNLHAKQKREARAAFWAGLATAAVAVGEAVYMSDNHYYAHGSLTLSTALLAYSIADMITERMGVNYNATQEYNADAVSVEYLKYVQRDTGALASILERIKSYYLKTGNIKALSSGTTHPSVNSRIQRIPKASIQSDSVYLREIATVNTFNAKLAFDRQHFAACKTLVRSNIDVGVGMDEDLLLLAKVTLFMENTPKSNSHVIELLKQAKKRSKPFGSSATQLSIQKYLAITHLRMLNKEEAKQAIDEYQSLLQSQIDSLKSMQNESIWAAVYSYLNQEVTWARRLQSRIDSL